MCNPLEITDRISLRIVFADRVLVLPCLIVSEYRMTPSTEDTILPLSRPHNLPIHYAVRYSSLPYCKLLCCFITPIAWMQVLVSNPKPRLSSLVASAIVATVSSTSVASCHHLMLHLRCLLLVRIDIL